MAEVEIVWREDGDDWIGEAPEVPRAMILIVPDDSGWVVSVYDSLTVVRREEHRDIDDAKAAALPVMRLLALRKQA